MSLVLRALEILSVGREWVVHACRVEAGALERGAVKQNGMLSIGCWNMFDNRDVWLWRREGGGILLVVEVASCM